MNRWMSLALTLCLACASTGAFAKAPTALFYMIEMQKSINSFEAHVDKVDLLVPTWFGVDGNGLVSGAPNLYVLKLAKAHRVPVMPIISAGGDRKKFHDLLVNETAKKAMIDGMLEQAKLYGFVGFQFDFENIAWTDRDALTLLTQQTATALHKHGLKLSMAVVPNAPGYSGRGPFAKWIWEYWKGAYDLKALGQALDLVCLMTYDQHTRWTTPGPVAGMPWVMANLEYALKVVPKEKLSLGIGLYGYHWFAGDPVGADGKESSNISAQYIDADESFPLAKQFNAAMQWDPVEHESWFYFYRDQMREWVFLPDAHAFRDRYDVVKQYGLEGFCAWVIGAEDPNIWEALPDAVR
ncbi:glycosyl hydrolase family 18 protein [Dyella japonica]|uniref:Glycosyl hydrolase n=1 Tax=Dyella japonica DSM 16301 TaxID=1440762 RepID=A0A0G9H979_9GAMM|nr:glycosyl hydrolase family 18 protein [Dyella japonica]KLD66128.1 glycosyl hydrolase [Dyella japonica DSM 16301]